MNEKGQKMRIIFFSLLLMIVWAVNASGEVTNRVVAVVNDDLITLFELNQTIEELTGLKPEALRARNENEFMQIRKRVLDFLIDEKITDAKIRERGIVVTPEQIDNAIEGIKRDNNITQEDLLAELKNRGLSYKKYREHIKQDLERHHLINAEVKSRIVLREERVKEFYQENLDDYRLEESIRIASIYLDSKNPPQGRNLDELTLRMNQILMRLKQGEDFYRIAAETAREHGTVLNGDLGHFKKSELDPGLVEKLRDIPEGEISKMIMRPNGIQVIKVVERQEAGVKPFAEVRNAIYSILYREEVEKRYVAWIEELRKRAYIRITF